MLRLQGVCKACSLPHILPRTPGSDDREAPHSSAEEPATQPHSLFWVSQPQTTGHSPSQSARLARRACCPTGFRAVSLGSPQVRALACIVQLCSLPFRHSALRKGSCRGPRSHIGPALPHQMRLKVTNVANLSSSFSSDSQTKSKGVEELPLCILRPRLFITSDFKLI